MYCLKSLYLQYRLIERLDQSHIHPKLEVERLTCLSRESNPGRGKHSSKELFEQRVNIQIWARDSRINCVKCQILTRVPTLRAGTPVRITASQFNCKKTTKTLNFKALEILLLCILCIVSNGLQLLANMRFILVVSLVYSMVHSVEVSVPSSELGPPFPTSSPR